MKKVFMGMCIMSITASCQAMLRTIGQLPRITHISAQAATLGKRNASSQSIAVVTAQNLYKKRYEKYRHWEKILKRTQQKLDALEFPKDILERGLKHATSLDYSQYENEVDKAEKKLNDAICLQNFAHSLDIYYEQLQGCFEFNDGKRAAQYRDEMAQDLAALIEQINPELKEMV